MWRGRGDVKRGAGGRAYPGLVAGRRFAEVVDFEACLFAGDFVALLFAALAFVPLALAAAAFFFVVLFAAGAAAPPATAPDETREECFARGRTFFVAASAADAVSSAARSATISRVIVVRIIGRASKSRLR